MLRDTKQTKLEQRLDISRNPISLSYGYYGISLPHYCNSGWAWFCMKELSLSTPHDWNPALLPPSFFPSFLLCLWAIKILKHMIVSILVMTLCITWLLCLPVSEKNSNDHIALGFPSCSTWLLYRYYKVYNMSKNMNAMSSQRAGAHTITYQQFGSFRAYITVTFTGWNGMLLPKMSSLLHAMIFPPLTRNYFAPESLPWHCDGIFNDSRNVQQKTQGSEAWRQDPCKK